MSYRLEKTFEGSIELKDKKGVLDPAKTKKSVKMDSQKDPLDVVISAINENYKGSFTDADRVLVGTLREKLKADKKLRKAAKVDGQQIFEKNVFPKISIRLRRSHILRVRRHIHLCSRIKPSIRLS